MLNYNAIATLFDHNEDKQPQKRKSCVMREETNTKRQLYEQAIQHDELVQSFELDSNTKETQTYMVFEETSVTKIDVGVQCDIGTQEPFHIPLTSSGTEESDNQSSDELSESEYESPTDSLQKPHLSFIGHRY